MGYFRGCNLDWLDKSRSRLHQQTLGSTIRQAASTLWYCYEISKSYERCLLRWALEVKFVGRAEMGRISALRRSTKLLPCANMVLGFGYGHNFWEHYNRPRKHSAARYTLIVDCRVTLEDTSAPFGKVREGKLTIRGVFRTLKWNGDEQIPRAGLDPAMIPVPANGMIPSPLFHDEIVAFATPDVAMEVCYVKSDSVYQDLEEVMFYMGQDQEGVNEIRRLVFLVPIDPATALMLEKLDERTFTRLGLVEFEDEEKLEQYFDGCEEKTFTIY